MSKLNDYVDGELCPRGCGVPVERVHRVYPNMKGPPYHLCPKLPHLMARIAADIADKQLRKEYGDKIVDDMREWIESTTWYGDKPREFEWANKPPKKR